MSEDEAPAGGDCLRVLLVEDDPDAALLMETQLRRDGIEHVCTRASCLSELSKHLVVPFPDLVLSDFALPDGTGLDVLARVQACAPCLPVIIVTGAVSEDVAVNCLRKGAADYLLKSSLLRMGAAVRGALARSHDKKRIETLAMMTDKCPHPVLRVGQGGCVLYANRASEAFLQCLARGADISQGCTWADLIDTAIARNAACTTEITSRDAVYSVTFTPWQEQDCACVAVHAYDITERKRAENHRDRLVAAIDQTREIIVITDPQGTIEYVNPAFECVSGYTRGEAIGRKPSLIKSGMHDQAFYANLWRTLTAGQVWRGGFTNRAKDGTTWQETATISPVRDDAGRLTNFVAVKHDVTDESKLRNQLYHSQKMEAIGTLAGGIAHDFNNILTSVIGYAGLAHSELDPDGRPAENLEHVLRAARRASDLVKQILAFSRQSKQETRPMVVQPLLRETTKLLESSLPSTIEIRCRIDADCGPVLADPSQIHQVIMNLCVNAFSAMKGQGGVLDLCLEELVIDEPVTASPHDLQVGRYLRLSVADTGCGMDKATMYRIFEPYFTTGADGEGTGLGLSTVHGILKGTGGAVTVQSEVGKGTVFRVYLPVCLAPLSKRQEESRHGPLPGRGERILFVDDETMLAEFGEVALDRLGYSVSVFTKSKAALAAFRDAPTEFDLILTDQVMPGLTGMELAAAASAIRPDIPVILTTGFSQKITDEMCRKRGIHGFVMKPLVVRELSIAIRRALGDDIPDSPQ